MEKDNLNTEKVKSEKASADSHSVERLVIQSFFLFKDKPILFIK